jgi:hypothetical protein
MFYSQKLNNNELCVPLVRTCPTGCNPVTIRVALEVSLLLVGFLGLLSSTHVIHTDLSALKLPGSVVFTTVGTLALARSIMTAIGKKMRSEILEQSGPQNVVLMSEILENESQDFHVLMNGAKELRKILPKGSQIRVIYNDPLLRDFPLEKYGFTTADVQNYADPSKFSKEDPFIAKAHLMLSLPRPSDWQREIYKKSPHALKMCVGEYGATEAPRSCMGLKKDDLGIFLPEIIPAQAFKDPKLQQLFAARATAPYFCDTTQAPIPFLNYVGATQKTIKDDVMVICPYSRFPGKDWLVAIDFKEYGIKTIIGVKDGKETVLHEADLENGKVLRLFEFPLCHEDFLLCIQKSQPVVGCSGDLPFSEVLAAGKIPLYEIQLGDDTNSLQKRDFWTGLISFAEKNGKKHVVAFANRVINNTLHEIPETAALQQEFQELRDIVCKKHQLKFALRAIVNERLFQRAHPTLASLV